MYDLQCVTSVLFELPVSPYYCGMEHPYGLTRGRVSPRSSGISRLSDTGRYSRLLLRANQDHFHADPILIEFGNWQSTSRIPFCILKHCLTLFNETILIWFPKILIWFPNQDSTNYRKFFLSWKNRSDPDPQLSGSATLNNWFNC